MHKKTKNGFTLIELMIVVVILGVLIAVVGGLILKGCGFSKDRAEAAAREWCQKMGYQAQGVDCVAKDTDGDGYVSCTVNAVDSKGNQAPLALECAGVMSGNEGCRMQKPTVRGGW